MTEKKYHHQNILFIVTIIAAAYTIAVIIITTPSPLSYAFDFGNETCIADASNAFMDGYPHGAHEDYLTVIGMFKDHKFSTLQAAEQSIYNETSGANAFSQYRYDPMTGNKIHITDYTNDYINGYREGWKDAQKGIYQVHC
jgi:hypothetical protein